jgi:UDP-glucose 4-epimerase
MAIVVAEAMEAKTDIVHLDARNEVKIAFSDHSKAEKIFGKQPQTSFQAGVRAMAKWVKAHGARESNVFEAIEVHKNLPASWARAAQKSISFR